MHAFRICKSKYADTAFSGRGAKEYGGRWNSKGNFVVYLADSAPLATLETLIHIDNSKALENYCFFKIDIPDSKVIRLSDSELPLDWSESPIPFSTMDVGDKWLISGESLALSVPSTASPYGGRNLVINVEHPDFDAVFTDLTPHDYSLDERLLKNE